MQLIAPTNWDKKLIPVYEKCGISEAYGKMAVDFIGGGRPAYILPDVSRRHVAEHLKELRAAGIKFNYILNSPCLGSQEFTRTGRQNIHELLRWLVKIGVDKVTVSIPYLAQFVKENYPSLEIGVSVFAGVDTVEKGLFWEELGAVDITLLQTTVNRNFNLLKLLRKHLKCKLRLIGNTGCLYQCPMVGYHALNNAQASQSTHAHKAGLAIDYCSLSCRYLRLQDPEKFIRSNWIRPEDLSLYEEIGIDGIKLVDRRCTTEQLGKIVESYSQRHFEGNLLELLPLFYGRPPSVTKKNLLLKLKYFFHPLESNLLALPRLNYLMQDLPIVMDNRKLDGFIQKFIAEDCSVKSCAACGYCKRVADEVVTFDEKNLAVLETAYKDFLADMAKGKV